jgi:sugar/nucleoside kinase (ribokinase family)
MAKVEARVVPPLDVCVVGEINPDLILYGVPSNLQPERETIIDGLRLTLGSSSAIFAHNLSALGARVGIASKIGRDAFGEMALGWLADAGVDVSRVVVATESSTGVTVILPNQSGRFILTYPGSIFELRYQDLDLDYVFSARHLHLSSFFLHKALRPQIPDLFRSAKAKGLTTSLDTNDDPAGEWGSDVSEVLKFVDVFLPNENEAKKIARTNDVTQALQLLSRSSKLVVVKRGAEGAIAFDGRREFRAAALPVAARDPVGAGDSFDAGFIRRFLDGASTEEALAFANVAGAYSTTGEGGIEAFRNREKMRDFFSAHSRAGKIPEGPATQT